MGYWPTKVVVDLNKIRHNVGEIRKRIGPDVRMMLVVKADSYGHGACAAAKAAREAGADLFGVACIDEAILLREGGIDCPIMIVGISFPDAIPEIVHQDVMPAVCDLSWARKLSAEALRQGRTVKVHVNVNTGMNRFGIEPEETVPFLTELAKLPNIETEGLYTHLATAYSTTESSAQAVRKQFSIFCSVINEVKQAGFEIPYTHCANTGALMNYPETFLNMVRPGLIMTTPFASTSNHGMDIKECFELKSKVIHVRELKRGEPLGYDQLYICERDTKIAVVSAGWADGIPRELTNCGAVLIHGGRCPIRGRVMCDQIFADITDIKSDVTVGDEVVILGEQGNEKISGWEWREILGGVSSPVTLRSHRSGRVAVEYIG